MNSQFKKRPGWRAGNILDVRSAAEFKQGHLRGSVSIPLVEGSEISWSSQDLEREIPSIFLPPRHEALLVVARKIGMAKGLAAHLKARGRQDVDFFVWEEGGVPTDILSRGGSMAHLWSAPDWLVHHESLLPPPAAGPVLDLACGSGRALVWLARKGYRTVGIDWQPEALTLGRTLAASQGVACQFEPGDLRDLSQVPQGPWAVILNFRFLERDLLKSIPGLLQPGGVALVRTFRRVAGFQGQPHRRHCLHCCELLGAFPAGCCEILAHEEGFDSDGRPAAGIVARRRIT